MELMFAKAIKALQAAEMYRSYYASGPESTEKIKELANMLRVKSKGKTDERFLHAIADALDSI